jgi:gamma-glutamyltranspeptidase / glutathione hydrolase
VETIDIPGAVAGWDALRSRFGTLPFSEILAPAIYYAQNGFPLAERNARYWVAENLMQQPGYKETYLPNGFTPNVGDEFRNPALANSLREIAEHGRDAFYNGPMTETMVKFLQAQGGTHTFEDFRDFQPEWVDPISTTYRGWTIYELPPNGQGIAALAMLNIIEQFPLGRYPHNSADALHIMIEAKKLAYADMYKYVGDPRFTPIPVKEMLSKELARKRASLIKMDKAACEVVPSDIKKMLDAHGNSTIFLSTIDKEGNIVSLIQSNFAGYGTGMVAPGLGFSFQNRGAGFQ